MNRLRESIPFLTGLLCGLIFLSFNITGFDLSFFPGDLADARFNNYLLEHCYQFFTGNVENFWNAGFIHPEPQVITYSDNLLGSAPFYALFRIIGCDRETAFQCWFLLMIVLAYTCCYFFLKFLFKNKAAAVIGALVFAFSLALQSQIAHAQTMPRFAIPLAFWSALLYQRELKPKYFFAAIMLLVYQIYCGIYLGLMLSIPVAVLLACSLFRIRKYNVLIESWKWWLQMAGSGVIALLTLYPLLKPYLERAKQMGMHPYNEVMQSIPTLRSFFYSRPGSLLWEPLNNTGAKYQFPWDHQIFPGGIAMISLIVFLGFCAWIMFIRNKKQIPDEHETELKILFVVTLVTFLCFIRFQGTSLYQYIYALPGFGSMRALQRIINIELIFFAVAAAFCSKWLFEKFQRKSMLTFGLMVLLFIADNHLDHSSMTVYSKNESKRRIENWASRMKGLPEGSVVSVEADTVVADVNGFQLDAMLAAQSHGLKSINGYSSKAPDNYWQFWSSPNAESRMIWLREKKDTTMKVFVFK
jgi:hypothetical protein